MKEPSGLAWVSRFPGTNKTSDLTPAFKAAAEAFIDAVRAAGATVKISATFRPPERAYLMHHAWAIARENVDPASVPPREGVDIDWVHRTAAGAADLAKSKRAAEDMVGPGGYNMVHIAALFSHHTEKRAIDMNIGWSGNLAVKKKDGTGVTVTTTPRDGMNADLQKVGASYGVVKLLTDPPHWSDDGH